MRALSIRQPWAWLILHAGKDIENRVWASAYKGPLLIHAAKGMTRDEYDEVADWLNEPIDDRLDGIVLPGRETIERGGVVGIVQMNGSVTASESPWFFGPNGFRLSNPQAFLAVIPFKGQLGFFDVPDALIEAEQIGNPVSGEGASDA